MHTSLCKVKQIVSGMCKAIVLGGRYIHTLYAHCIIVSIYVTCTPLRGKPPRGAVVLIAPCRVKHFRTSHVPLVLVKLPLDSTVISF